MLSENLSGLKTSGTLPIRYAIVVLRPEETRQVHDTGWRKWFLQIVGHFFCKNCAFSRVMETDCKYAVKKTSETFQLSPEGRTFFNSLPLSLVGKISYQRSRSSDGFDHPMSTPFAERPFLGAFFANLINLTVTSETIKRYRALGLIVSEVIWACPSLVV